MELSKDQKILNAVVRKAWQDPVFKAHLISNPLPAIEELIGEKMKLPVGKKIAFIDQTDESTIFITIPPEPEMEDVELNEEQLDIISGGDGSIGSVIVKPSNYSGELFV